MESFTAPWQMRKYYEVMCDSCNSEGRALMMLMTDTSSLGHGGGDFMMDTTIPPSLRVIIEPILGRWCNDKISFVGDYSERFDDEDRDGITDISSWVWRAFFAQMLCMSVGEDESEWEKWCTHDMVRTDDAFGLMMTEMLVQPDSGRRDVDSEVQVHCHVVKKILDLSYLDVHIPIEDPSRDVFTHFVSKDGVWCFNSFLFEKDVPTQGFNIEDTKEVKIRSITERKKTENKYVCSEGKEAYIQTKFVRRDRWSYFFHSKIGKDELWGFILPSVYIPQRKKEDLDSLFELKETKPIYEDTICPFTERKYKLWMCGKKYDILMKSMKTWYWHGSSVMDTEKGGEKTESMESFLCKKWLCDEKDVTRIFLYADVRVARMTGECEFINHDWMKEDVFKDNPVKSNFIRPVWKLYFQNTKMDPEWMEKNGINKYSKNIGGEFLFFGPLALERIR